MPWSGFLKSLPLGAGALLAGAAFGYGIKLRSVRALPVSVAETTIRPADPLIEGILPITRVRLEALQRAGTPSRQLACILTFGEITRLAEIRDLLGKASLFPNHSARELAVSMLLQNWLRQEPDSAIAYCRIHHETILPKLLASLAATHPAEAEARILALPPSSIRAEAWAELCSITFQRDPDEAWALLGRSPDPDYSIRFYLKPVIDSLVKRDPWKASGLLESLPAEMQTDVSIGIAQALMQSDPVRGWEWVNQQRRDDRVKAAALSAAFKTNPHQGMEYWCGIESYERERITLRADHTWTAVDLIAFAEALHNEARLNAEEKTDLAKGLPGFITPGNAEGMKALLPFLGEEGLASIIGSQLHSMGQDEAEVREWIRGLPEGPVKAVAGKMMQDRMAASGPDGRAPETLADDLASGHFIDDHDPRLKKLTPEILTTALSRDQSPGHYVFLNLIEDLGTQNPSVAAAWLESIPLDDESGPAAAQFSESWAETDPAAAGAWVSKLPPGNLAMNAAANVALQYHRYDPEEAAAWVERLTPGSVRDAARRAVAGP